MLFCANRVRLAAIVALLFVLAGSVASSWAAAGPVVAVRSGKLKGIVSGGIEKFLGIPYAAPPLEKRRWLAPGPPESWSGIRSATATRTGCAAPVSGDGPASDAEDCLYLNVYRPAGTVVGESLPIVVFIHGGANSWGSPGIYDGERMARIAHAVVVIPAYRLGVFGFLALPGLAAGDAALQDQIAALKWVHANAGTLGGSRSKVTIVGESAGGTNVCNILATPTARGLFSAAVVQSGFCYGAPSLASAETVGKAVANHAGCTNQAIECLRSLPVSKLLDAWNAAWAEQAGVAGLFPMTPIEPTPTLPAAPSTRAPASPVPVLIGFDRDELRGFLSGAYPLSASKFKATVTAAYGNDAEAVEAEYPPGSQPDPVYVLAALRSDQMIICPSFATADRLAGKSPVSMYEFADRTAPAFKSLGFPAPAVPGFEPGAGHTAELQYLFAYQAAAQPLSNDQNRLADEMVKQWVAFGRPAAAQVWKRYDPRNRETTFLDLSDSAGLHTVSDAFERHHCGFWAAHPTMPASLLP